MIVDAFTVAGGYPVRPEPLGVEQLRQAMDRNGVERAMTMSLRAIQVDAAVGNDYICSVAREDPRILPVAVVDPRDVLRAEQVIAAAVAGGAVALAFHLTAIPCPPGSILFRRALKQAAATGLPLVFVANAAGQLTQIAEMTRDAGCDRVLLAGASYHHLGELMALLEEFPHIWAEASWQVSPGSVALLARSGHSGRVLFGSMAPMRPVRPALNMVAEADLTPEEKWDILGRNALRFLGREAEAVAATGPEPEILGTPPVPAIDVHCHFRVMPEQPSTCLGGADIQRELERFNIECAVVSSTAAYKDDLNVGNQETLDHLDLFERMRGSVVVNPHHLADSVRWLDLAARDPRIAHVTINPLSTYESYTSPQWIHLFAEIAARRLPVFYNTGGQDLYRRSATATVQGHLFKVRGAPADEVAMFRRIDQLYPHTPVIIGHGHGLEGLDLARTCRNIHLELCTSYPEQNVYRRAVDAVGAERVLFGTDLEMISPAFVCGSIWEAGLTEEEARLVFRDNARRLLELP